MKEKILALSLGLSFAFPAILDSFYLPYKFGNRNDFQQKIRQETNELVSEPIQNTTEEVNIIDSSNEEIAEENNSIKDETTKKFIPYNIINEKLTNFKSQSYTDDPNGFSSSINMECTSNYDSVQGISTFRGNNYRQNAFYGSASVNEKVFQKIWTNVVGRTDNWTGIGWNGQPAIIKWDKDVKLQMNIYDEFKQNENFTEVIVGGLDSTIHFYDLDTGHKSRPSIKVPSSIKGSVTIDPRGYPLLYVGQGIDKVAGVSVKMGYHIFSLITGEELHFINGRDKYAYIGWGAFDGNPIIDAKTDTMILPGENGVVYIIKLNTNYDKENGSISISPITTKYKYTKNGKAGGMENAMTIFKNYAFFGNNNGVIQCLDLSSLTPVWSFNMEDDCDATIGLDEESGEVFLYVGCEVDKRAKTAPAYIRKLDGRTGTPLWEYSCDCKFDSSVNGGVLSSPIVGQNSISDLVIFNFSKVTSYYNGKMVALDKSTGNVVWEKNLNYYSWSSPVAIYSDDGQTYIVFCDFSGTISLIDARTGETITSLQTGGGNVEGSPAIFDNHIVFGTRGQKVFRIDVK